MSKRYTVAVDFDGVLHSYVSPWKNAWTIPDPPVPGAIEWLSQMVEKFDVAVFSTRNRSFFGRWAMKSWLRRHTYNHYADLAYGAGRHWTHLDTEEEAWRAAVGTIARFKFPKHKPAALIYVDDRAYRFEGHFPTADEIHRARPWNKEKAA